MIALLIGLAVAQAADCTVIAGGRLHLPTGVQEGGVLILDGSAIAYAGGPRGDVAISGTSATWGARRCSAVDATGKEVTAGLIEASSEMGLVEVGAESATVNADGGGPSAIRAALRVADAYDPRASAIAVSRTGGITAAVVSPRGGLVSGQAAWAELAGDTQAEAVINPSIAMIASLGATPSRAEDLLQLRQLLDEARLYAKLKGDWAAKQIAPLGVTQLDLAALQLVLDRTIPLVVAADRASDIEAVLRFGKEQQIRLVIAGGAEAWLDADALAAAKVPVILDPLVYGAGSFDQRYGRADNGALLDNAGVSVVIATFQTHNARTLRQVAGNAVRGGLDHEAAIRAITSGPAAAFGMTDHGELTAGKVADVAVWTGDPLELSTNLSALWIGGRPQTLESRQTALFQKYRTLPGTPVPALTIR